MTSWCANVQLNFCLHNDDKILSLSFLLYLSVFPLYPPHWFPFIFFQVLPCFPTIFPLCVFACACVSSMLLFSHYEFYCSFEHLKSLHVPRGKAGAHGPAEDEGRGKRKEKKKKKRRIRDTKEKNMKRFEMKQMSNMQI